MARDISIFIQSLSANMRAVLLMITAMSAFGVADTLLRRAQLGSDLSPSVGQFLMMHGIYATVLYSLLVMRSKEAISLDLLIDGKVFLRSLGDLAAAICFVTSLTLIPVGTASAILQIQPIVVTLGAVIFLKEYVNLQRWLAIVLGFVGVLIIINPGMDGFEHGALLVLAAVAFLSIRDLVTRLVNPNYSTLMMSLYVSIGFIPTGYLYHLWAGASNVIMLDKAIFLLVPVTFVMLGSYTITMAMRLGEVSIVAPFRYSRLVAAFIAAFFILGERPDFLTLVGSVLVVVAGVSVLYRRSP